MNDISVADYMEQVYNGKLKAFSDTKDTHFVHGLDLLSIYGAASKNYVGNWNFNYSIFDINRCLYLTPTVASLSTVSSNSQIGKKIFDNDGYKFFQQVSVNNISNILTLIKEHLDVLSLIYNSKYIDKALYKEMHKTLAGSIVTMYPSYQKISRSDVCFDIMNNTDFLGPRNGITTQEHGRPLYLAAATSAATSHIVMGRFINSFELDDKLKDINGNEIAPNMDIEVQNRLARMYLYKKLRDSTDIYAYFRNYAITDRDIVVNALQFSYANKMYSPANDALTVVVDEISKSIF